MKLRDNVINLLEESRSHPRASQAISAAQRDGRMDMKATINIISLILDHLEENEEN